MTPANLRRALIALGATGVALALPASAGAFGTIDGKMGQHAEHEKITRVLSCVATDKPQACFDPLSTDQLAGKKGTLGGVGIPDSPLEILGHPEAHCDDADYLPGLPYQDSAAARAANAISACVTNFGRNLDRAVTAAGTIVDESGALQDDEVQIVENCVMGSSSEKRGKCNTLEYLGRSLHAAEDFWSHTDWADRSNPAKPEILKPAVVSEDGKVTPATYDITNPYGLLRTELVPYLRYPVPTGLIPTAAQIQAGLAPISGCDDSAQGVASWIDGISEVLIGGDGPIGELCPNRVGHSHLNKDKGDIDPKTGTVSNPTTPRGQIGDNMQRAVTGARAQAKAVWADFGTAVTARYGDERGGKILAALTDDTPWTTCDVDGTSGTWAAWPPKQDRTSTRTVTTRVDNRTGEPLACGDTTLSHGIFASYPPDSVASGAAESFRVESELNSGSGGPEGTVAYAIGDSGYQVRYRWNNPLVGSNSMTCEIVRDGVADSGAPYKCDVRDTRGNKATPTLTVSNR